MPDDLWLSGGGTTMVGTDAMFGQAHGIELLAISLRGALAAMNAAWESTPPHTRGRTGGRAVADDLATAIACADRAREEAEQISYHLYLAMSAYGEGEEAALRTAEAVGAGFGFLAGASAATMFLVFGPFGPAAAGFLPFLAGAAFASDDTTVSPDDMTGDPDLNRAMSDPGFVDWLRNMVSSSDEFALGFGGVPAFLQSGIAAGTGADGVASTALLLALYGSYTGLFVETPVSITRTADLSATPPSGFADRLSRIPDPATSPGGAQVRIDRVSIPGEPARFEIYIGGTENFNPVSADTPFDMTSNVIGVGGLPAGSMRAVQEAMREAGITPDSRVTFTGHSQGALVAASLASSGDWNTVGLVTVGSPAGHVVVPPGFPAVIIEHEEDLVPALGGVQQNHDALIVQRRIWSDPADIPGDVAVPGHRMPHYLETGRLLDAAQSPQVTAAASALDAVSAEGTVTSSYYRAERQH